MIQPFTLDAQPGIQRDGTAFDANRYLDSLWCRWRLGRPRKMGGIQVITNGLNGLPRRIHCWYNGGQIIAHVGTNNGIQQVIFDTLGNLIAINDRTPAGYLGGPLTGVSFDALFDTTSDVVQLVAHAGPNNQFLATPVKTTPYLGQIDGGTPLQPFTVPPNLFTGTWTQPNVSGGVACVQPYVWDFDSDGLVQWSAPNLALTLGLVGGTSGAGQARISSQKIVNLMPLRGGGSASPAALIWSMSEVITASFIGGAPVWAFNTVSPSSSVLSGASMVEYDGLYFWPGVDRFLVFNGVVTEVPNTQNQDWFFSNLTPGYEAQTWGFKVPRYGEIWWGACMFGSTVPNYAIIFNLRENCWYDTVLPTDTWSAGYFAQGFRLPLTAGQDNGLYKLWLTESGTDNVDPIAGTVEAIRSYFETPIFGGPKNNPPDDKVLSVANLEPDIEQSGDMSVYLIGQPNARVAPTNGPSVPLIGTPTVGQRFPGFTPEQSQRLTRLHVESNVVGGTYITGRNLLRAQPAERTTSF